MKIVDPHARMMSPLNPMIPFTRQDGIGMLRRVEYCARVSHRSEDAIGPDSWERFLRSVVVGHGDWSVVEHEKVTCEFLVDRGITHEIVRHRIGSYTQESTRFVNYQKSGGEARFVVPLGIVENPKSLEEFATFDEYVAYTNWPEHRAWATWRRSVATAEGAYMSLCAEGVKPQIARSVLPNALASKIVVTYNLRTWRHFFVMRTCAEAHPQMRQVVDPLLAEFQAKVPILYEDIEPGERQAEAMRRAR